MGLSTQLLRGQLDVEKFQNAKEKNREIISVSGKRKNIPSWGKWGFF